MDDETFGKLENLNIDIDVLIDEEKYDDVYKLFELRDGLHLKDCFRSLHSTHSTDEDNNWNSILFDIGDLPVTKADGVSLLDDSDLATKMWSCLLYAKLIRARIQKMGTDCYLRRLDDVIAYLERNLPQVSPKAPRRERKHLNKLYLFYLFELAASSRESEMLGFAKRAYQVLMRNWPKEEAKRPYLKEEFCWFYDLLAHYNYGVAYFHEGRYRLAVREFNYVIKNATATELDKPENSKKKEFFIAHEGNLFLFLPSVLYRADIQIKLQLAYHSLDTLRRYFFTAGNEITTHKKIRAELISAEANQQMDDLSRSWIHLNEAFKCISNLEGLAEELGITRNFRGLPERFRKQPYQNIKGRFVDIFVEDHLDWLETTYEPKNEGYKFSHSLENTYRNVSSCLNMLQSLFSKIYFKRANYVAVNRNGYYQQLAKLLAWLTKKFKKLGRGKLAESEDGKPEPNLCELAVQLYLDNQKGLMQNEKDKEEVVCPECKWQGIDLGRLEPEHHEWFTKYMFEFYKGMEACYESTKSVLSSEKQKTRQTLAKNKEEFIKRLLVIEREVREDLRITDLELRYKLDSVANNLVPDNNYRALCQGELQRNSSIFNKAFANLLACAGTTQGREELITSGQYEQIMKNWREHFSRHLKQRSTHKLHKNGLYFISLQRWNSSSPAQGRSVGGGYLLYKTDKYGTVDLGLAIDPGFDFLRNLFHMGFSLDDIDFILISHAHADHIRDFESIAIMLRELKKREEKKKTVHVILTLGAYKRLKHIIEDPTFRFFIDPYIIDVHKEIDPVYFENLKKYAFHFEKQADTNATSPQFPRYRPQINPNKNTLLSIYPTQAYHKDSSLYSDSFGFQIKVNLNDDMVTFGYTGDTKWVYPKIDDPLSDDIPNRERIIRDISTQYKYCDAVVVHLGSLIADKTLFKYYNQCRESVFTDETVETVCERLIQKEEHPYIVGLLRMLSSLYGYRKPNSKSKQLILLSEFGEELGGGIRKDLVERLKRAYDRRLAFLPLDVGIDVQLWHKADYQDGKRHPIQKVWCVQCERFVDIDEADFERYGVDEALFCVCKTCRKATSSDVLQLRLHRLYEEGRELRTVED